MEGRICMKGMGDGGNESAELEKVAGWLGWWEIVGKKVCTQGWDAGTEKWGNRAILHEFGEFNVHLLSCKLPKRDTKCCSSSLHVADQAQMFGETVPRLYKKDCWSFHLLTILTPFPIQRFLTLASSIVRVRSYQTGGTAPRVPLG